MAAALEVVFGLRVFLPLAYILPFGLSNMIVMHIVCGGEWNAGVALLKDANAGRWAQIVADTNLVDANRDKISDCQKAATTAKKDRRWSITVKLQW
jgi:hypothetical protein